MAKDMRKAINLWLMKLCIVYHPPYRYYDGVKVYGDTEEERQRVLGYLRNEIPK